MQVVTYELYVFRKGRWALEERFEDGNRKEVAIDAAQALFAGPSIDAVSVIKETFRQDDGTARDIEIYSNAKHGNVPRFRGKSIKPRGESSSGTERARLAATSRDGASGRVGTGAAQASSGGHHTSGDAASAAPSPFVFLYKVLAVFVGGVMLATGMVYLLSLMNSSALLGDYSSFVGHGNAQIKIFVVAVVLFIVVLSAILFSRGELTAFLDANASRGTAARHNPDRQDTHPHESSPSELARYAGTSPEEDTPGDDDGPEEDAEEEEFSWKIDDDEGEAEFNIDEIMYEKMIEEAKLTIITFFGRCLTYLNANELHVRNGRLDTYNTFGCHLFLAGACEAYSEIKQLDPSMLPQVLENCIEVMGRSPKRAKRFTENFGNYLSEPKYFEMFKSGREAVQRFMTELDPAPEPDPGEETGGPDQAASAADEIGACLAAALEQWNMPASERQDQGTVAVLFTDIVSSTKFTQDHGDATSQLLVRAHDGVVRGAIKKFDGREIKHTGDGIMASYPQIWTAVESAIEMQQGAALHTDATSELPLYLCIGISAGEPIRQDGDLFGTTVQLAARLCGAAESDEILVSNAVRELCAGKKIDFLDRGAQDFKGFKDPVGISEVKWRRDGEAVPASQSAA